MDTSKVARRMMTDESGQALAEYGLILAFIFAVCVIAVTLLGVAISTSLGGLLPAL